MHRQRPTACTRTGHAIQVLTAVLTLSLRGGGLKADDVAISRQSVLVGTSLRLPRRLRLLAMTEMIVCTAVPTLSLRGGGLKADDVGRKGAPPVAE